MLTDNFIIQTNGENLVQSILVRYTDLSFLDNTKTIDWKVNLDYLDEELIVKEIYGDKKNIFTVREKEIILLVFIGTVLSFWIVGYSSGDFFAYTKSQIGNWDHSFSLPGFPLTTWRGYRILWLDGLALFLLGVVGLFILKNFKSQLNSISSGKSKNSLTEIFAIIGFVMSLLYVLFFHLEEVG